MVETPRNTHTHARARMCENMKTSTCMSRSAHVHMNWQTKTIFLSYFSNWNVSYDVIFRSRWKKKPDFNFCKWNNFRYRVVMKWKLQNRFSHTCWLACKCLASLLRRRLTFPSYQSTQIYTASLFVRGAVLKRIRWAWRVSENRIKPIRRWAFYVPASKIYVRAFITTPLSNVDHH